MNHTLTQTISTQKIATIARIFAILGIFILPVSTTLTDVFLLAAVVIGLFSSEIRGQYESVLKIRPVLFCGLLFVLYFIGVFYSVASWQAAFASLLKDAKLLYAIFLMPMFIDKKWRVYAISAFLTVMMITLVLSYLKVFGVIDWGQKYSHASIFKSHIQTNFLMAFVAYLLAYGAVIYKKWRIPILVLFLVTAYNVLFLSLGRSGYFVFVALILLLFWQFWRFKGLMIAILVVAVLAASAYFGSKDFRWRINQIVTNTEKFQAGNHDTSVGLRLSFYKNSLRLIQEKPIFGSGTGSFIPRYAALDPTYSTRNPHNEYLNVTVQLGVVGLIVLLLLFYFTWRDSFKLSARSQHVAQATMVAIALGCLANSWLMDTTEGHFFAVFLAISYAAMPIRKNAIK